MELLGGHNGAVKTVAFSKDGKYLASGGEDAAVNIWSTETWQLIRTNNWHAHTIKSVSWSPDSRYVVSSSYDSMQIFDVALDQIVSIYKDARWLTAEWSPVNSTIASIKGGIQIWDANSGDPVLTANDQKSIHSVSWSPDGKKLVYDWKKDNWFGGTQFALSIIDAKSGEFECLCDHKGHGWISRVLWSPNAQFIASGTGASGGYLFIWDANTGQKLDSYRYKENLSIDLAWSSDSRYIATCDKKVVVWDLQTKKSIVPFECVDIDICRCIAWSPNDNFLAVGSYTGMIVVSRVNIR